MNIEPHNLIDPLREKFPHLIRHEKLYRMIHRQLMKKWFQYFVLFFIIGSICSIIYSSFEESAPSRLSVTTLRTVSSGCVSNWFNTRTPWERKREVHPPAP